MKTVRINGSDLTVQSAVSIIEGNEKISLSSGARSKIKSSRDLVEKWLEQGEVIYGITTGFGEFKDVKIPFNEIEILQRNLILSHSAGVGSYLPDNIVRLMLLFRINALVKGFSGVRLSLINFMVEFFNSGIVPVIPSRGSVGSSGDLAPLSHLALCFIGEGYAKFNNEIMTSSQALELAGLKPVKLTAKEGLALINGTQMMSAFLCKSVFDSMYLSKLADISGSLSLEAMLGTSRAFDPKLQRARPHKGQSKTASNLRKLLAKSEIMDSHKDCGKVQDAYSLRCMPQVHGATKDIIAYCKNVTEIEINSATDNPLIFPETGEHIEGGNFHGQPVALASDFLKIGVSELGNISERRIARLVDGSLSGLPRFLTDSGGLNSGLMIAQYTTAALASENKILCHPASVDSIPTSANQEDHNSMGSIASRNLFAVVNNVKSILAIEMLCATQGIDYHRPLKSGRGAEVAYTLIRSAVPHLKRDVIVSEVIEKISAVVFNPEFISQIENSCGVLDW